MHGREILQLSKEQAVFVERRFAQVPSFGVSHKFIASFLDGQVSGFGFSTRCPFASHIAGKNTIGSVLEQLKPLCTLQNKS